MWRRAIGKWLVVLAVTEFLAAGPAGEAAEPKPAGYDSAAQAAGAARARELVQVDTTRFSAPPPLLLVNGEVKCNLQGDVYLVYTDEPQAVLSEHGGIARLPIRGLSISGGATAAYLVPSIPGYLDVVRYDFDVGPHGELYALLVGLRGKDPQTGADVLDYLIGKYNADGKFASYVNLASVPGETTEPLRLGTFAGGGFLVAGMLFGEGRGRAFVAVFDSGGNLVSELPTPDDITPVPYGQPRPPPTPSQAQAYRENGQQLAGSARHPTSALIAVSNTRIAGAPDGNAYLLWGTLPQRLWTVSPEGSLIRQFEVPAPGPGMSALRMGPAGPGEIFLAFDRVGSFVSSKGTGASPLTVVDASTGQVTAWYQPAEGEGSLAVAACASSPHDFLFVRSSDDKKNIVVVRYSATGF